jgi:mRNA interferase MazF
MTKKRYSSNHSPHRGDIFRASLDPTLGHELKKARPVLIISNNVLNEESTVIIVIPVTAGRYHYVHRVKINPPEGGLSKPSTLAVEQLRVIDKRRLQSYLGHLTETTLEKVEASLKDLFALPEGRILS